MELRHLRYFLGVAQYLSFSEAARRLHVAQSAISQTVVDLEEEIGVKLLQRTHHSVQLTAAGNAFLREAAEILNRAERAIKTAQSAASGEIGLISIGFILTATSPFLPGLIATYRSRFPQVTIELHEMTPAQQLEAMDDRRINLGFTRPLPAKRAREFHVEELFDDRLCIALPPTHALAREKVVDLLGLAGEPFVQFHRQGAPMLYDEAMATCRRAGFSPNVMYEPDVMNSVIFLVESGLGVSLVPDSLATRNYPRVVLRPIKPTSSRIPLCAFWPNSIEVPAVDAFMEVLRSAKAEIRKKMQCFRLTATDSP
jgi:DNA-binding transcriptional LysR family regulator